MPDISSSPSPRAPGMAARLLLRLIGLYRRTFSPLLPAVLGPACGCRFSPTCSHYAASAVATHGAVRGSWLALRRLVKCTPLHQGGFDPPPPSLRWTGPSSTDSARPIRPSCARVASTPLASGL